MERWGRIDVLVNSAGHGPRAPLLDLTDEDWHRGMEVYFLNVVRPTRLVTPVMQRAEGRRRSSTSRPSPPSSPSPLFPTSGVFRAGLAAFAKLFADRYAADNIRMNNVLPGFIDSLPEKEEFRERIPMGRYGKTEEIAATDRVPRLRRRRLHHRPEPPRRRRHHPLGLKPGRPLVPATRGSRARPCAGRRGPEESARTRAP